MEQPVVEFELVARDGTTLAGFLSYSEVFGCDSDTVTRLQDELPDDVSFYVSVGRSFRSTAVSYSEWLAYEDLEEALSA